LVKKPAQLVCQFLEGDSGNLGSCDYYVVEGGEDAIRVTKKSFLQSALDGIAVRFCAELLTCCDSDEPGSGECDETASFVRNPSPSLEDLLEASSRGAF